MNMRTLETDYLVVGCGAAGMAFTDALIDACGADVVMVDRRHAPGGHWLDAYPFVRLHQPSSFYGVNSLPLGQDAIASRGPEVGLYERASAAEICAYYERVMDERLLASGRVRHFPRCDYLGNDRFVSRTSGDEYRVKVRKRRVDATYLEAKVPSTHPPPFQLAREARCVPVNDLVRITDPPDRYVIIGGGKTSMDACLWLLERGVEPDRIQWIKPRELWLGNRVYLQGGKHVGTTFEGISLQMEAAAQAGSLDDLFARLNAARQLLRVDEGVTPSLYRGATSSEVELEQLRRIRDVVRLGYVQRIDHDEIVLDRGTIPTSPSHLHVHCAAPGLNRARAVPIFGPDLITLQSVRIGLTPFNAALVAFVEATRADVADQNRLCPPNRLPNSALDWLRGTIIATNAEHAWSQEPDITEWLERSRLNIARGLRACMSEPQVQSAWRRFVANVRPALARLQRLLRDTEASGAST